MSQATKYTGACQMSGFVRPQDEQQDREDRADEFPMGMNVIRELAAPRTADRGEIAGAQQANRDQGEPHGVRSPPHTDEEWDDEERIEFRKGGEPREIAPAMCRLVITK